MFRHPSRRAVLRTGTTVATIAAIGGITGCQRALLRGAELGRPESTETVKKWSPAPPDNADSFEGESPVYSVSYVGPKTLSNVNRRTDNDVLRGTKRAFSERIAPLDVPFEKVPFTLTLDHQTNVVRFKHDPNEVASSLDKEGFQARPEHRGFEVYWRREGSDDASDGSQEMEHIFAFDGEHVVNTRRRRIGNRESPSWFELVIDAHLGATDRYVEIDDHVDDLLSAAQPGDILDLSRDGPLSAFWDTPAQAPFQDNTSQCFSGRFAARAAEFQLLIEFPTVDEADPSVVNQYVESQREAGTGFLHAENIAYENRGRLVEVTYEIPLEDL